MSLNSIDNFFKSIHVWMIISFILMGWYLSPLFQQTFYVPVYDNLDSNVVWYKILAESGKIFADSDEIIPNMMNGLPRASYGSEFHLLLWFYYFFEPKTAYIINEVLIHLIAFFSMFILLKRYVSLEPKEYAHIPVFVGSLYFALLPFWSGSGASIALLPLATYSLLNIKNGKNNIWNWLFLILIPLYSSFILVYIFYILMAGVYFLYDTVKSKRFNTHFFFALFLFGTLYMLQNYRVVEVFFTEGTFISHRIEFNVFFKQSLWETYRISLDNFLNGHINHAPILVNYVLPIILIGMLLTLYRRALSYNESLIIWILICLSFATEIWTTLFIHRYTLPVLMVFSIYLLIFNKQYRTLPSLMILVIFLSIAGAMQTYEGFKSITDYIPLLKSFNIRIFFLLPFVYGILFVYSLKLFFKTLHLSSIFAVLLILFQFNLSLNASTFVTKERGKYASFESYYAFNMFKQIKQEMKQKGLQDGKFVSYGIEPAVALFNDMYTVDGYSANYPLSYKHLFGSVQQKECFTIMKQNKALYDNWGSKAYLLCIDSRPQMHKLMKQNELKEYPLHASPKKLCNIGTNYILSGIKLKDIDKQRIELIKYYNSKNVLWDIWFYKLHCSGSENTKQ